ncbi:unnamed protein product [Dovyalis caffra]|uniref:Disease resistance protein At4g27190-like leucine-rich repeats domain-containing protein n=1 Tax=Dovyalis caffra TaxID=77055 RepID=A0AAV1RWX2_9ROSI|nr:unnamed protein product [Dovyalis caffra]
MDNEYLLSILADIDHRTYILSPLRKLTLEGLPQLTSICSKVNGASTSQTKARSDIEIISEDELETPMPAFNRRIVFPDLEDLKLSALRIEKTRQVPRQVPALCCFVWSDQSIDLFSYFQKLTKLSVEGCGKLKYLFTSSMVKSLARLERLEICDCNLMEEIIAREGAIGREVAFPKLGFLKLCGLPNLIRFCTSNLIICPFLKELQI